MRPRRVAVTTWRSTSSRTTADIATPLPVMDISVRWISGGLDHQIEHHLAPRLPHTIYPLVAERFRKVCRQHDIAHHVHPGVWSALRSHARWLRTMSAQPATRSDPTIWSDPRPLERQAQP